MHVESGIYGNFAAGYMKDDAIEHRSRLPGSVPIPDDRSSFYAFEVGIEKKWHELGKTTLFGQYYHNEGGSQDRTVITVPDGFAWNDPTPRLRPTLTATVSKTVISSPLHSSPSG